MRERFARIARSPGDETPFPIGPESAKRLGYATDEADSLPLVAPESFAGVGNPLALGALRPGGLVTAFKPDLRLSSQASHDRRGERLPGDSV